MKPTNARSQRTKFNISFSLKGGNYELAEVAGESKERRLAPDEKPVSVMLLWPLHSEKDFHRWVRHREFNEVQFKANERMLFQILLAWIPRRCAMARQLRSRSANLPWFHTVPNTARESWISWLVPAARSEWINIVGKFAAALRFWSHLHLRWQHSNRVESIQILSDLQSKICALVSKSTCRPNPAATHIRHRGQRVLLHA